MRSVRYYTTLLIALFAVAIIPTVAQAQEAIPNTGSARLDGSGSLFVRDGAPFPLDPTATTGAYKIADNSITVEAWVFPLELPAHGAGHNIVLNPYAEAPWLAYSLSINNYEATDNPVFSFEVTDGTTPYNGAYVAGPTAVAGEWTHLAGVYDGTSVKLYVNGTLVDEAPFSGNIGAGHNGYLYVGGNGTESTFVGLIDEVRLWDSARTEAQVSANMDGTLVGTESGLAGYWPLNESTVLSNYRATEDATPNRNALYAFYAEFRPVAAGDAPAIPATIRTAAKTIVAGKSATAPFTTDGWPEPTVSLLDGPSGLEIAGSSVAWTPSAEARGAYQYILQAQNTHATVTDTGSFWVNAAALESASHTTESLTATVANDGSFGTPTSGEFIFDGKNGLFAGMLVIGQSGEQVSGQLFASEFAAMTAIEEVTSEYAGFETAYETRYNDSRAADPIGLEIVQRSHSKDSAPDRGYVIVEYDITNTSGTDLTDIYVGTAMDWDIGLSGDLGGFESESGLTYMYEAGDAPSNGNYYGVSALSGEVSGQALWPNSIEGETESAYYNRLTTFSAAPTTPGDFRAGVGTGPYAIAAGESVTVRFAVAGGGTLAQLTANVQAAQAAISAPLEPGVEPEVSSASPAPVEDGYFGEYMANVGDVNGDGAGDYLVHEFGPTPVHLFSGSDGALIRTLGAASSDSSDVYIGWPLADAGDVNSDGTPDFLIRGAQVQSETYAELVVYVVDGKDDSIIRRLASPNPVSAYDSDSFAESIANVGDVNGDGMPDYIVSATDEVVGGDATAGRAYLFSGADASVIHTFEAAEDGFGETVAAAGDLDGDGAPDVLVGSSMETVGSIEEAGRAYAYSGASGTSLYTIVSPNPVSFENLGGDEQIMSAGDVTGDNVPDILVGADEAGRAYVFDGSDGSHLRTIVEPGADSSPSNQLLASSRSTAGFFGSILAAGQDASGDGTPDFLIAGEESVYVISGASGESLSRLVAAAGESGSGFGTTARFIDDANDDGLPEIIIGAPQAAVSSKTNAGRTYMYSSSQIGTSVETPAALADGFHLHSAFPNPVSGRATIRYEVPRASDVRLEVYDVLGRRVATLARGMIQAGTHDAFLEAAPLSSGVYFYRLSAGEYTTTRSLVVVK